MTILDKLKGIFHIKITDLRAAILNSEDIAVKIYIWKVTN